MWAPPVPGSSVWSRGGAPAAACSRSSYSRLGVVKDIHREAARRYQHLIRTSSLPLRPQLYLGPRRGGEEGHWSGLLVRSNERGELMVRVSLHPTDLSEQQLEQVKQQLVSCFCSDGSLTVVSLYLSLLSPTGQQEHQKLLHGQLHLEEEVAGKVLLLGPDSGLQVLVLLLLLLPRQGPQASSLLVQAVKDRLGGGYGQTDTLLDLCGGAGFWSVHLGGRWGRYGG